MIWRNLYSQFFTNKQGKQIFELDQGTKTPIILSCITYSWEKLRIHLYCGKYYKDGSNIDQSLHFTQFDTNGDLCDL